MGVAWVWYGRSPNRQTVETERFEMAAVRFAELEEPQALRRPNVDANIGRVVTDGPIGCHRYRH